MAVIDAHGHLGPCTVFDVAAPEPEIISTMDEAGIDVALLQPFPGSPDAITTHNEIADLARRYPGRFYGIASVNPRFLGKKRYFEEVERCIKDLGFVGVKLHTIGHAINPLSEIGGWVFEAAAAFNVPIQVHTGTGIPFADPAACIPRAMQYPDVPVILVHAGWVLLSPAAYAAAKACPNVYLETSWSMGAEIAWWANDLGAHRLMMGADLPNNRTSEIAKYRALNLTDSQFELALGKTTADVYKLDV
jgi:predicted TIM-barrel fold metal-dependent hydrolase